MMYGMKKVRTRIAPSPTGDPHVGTAYMAIYNYLFAKHFGGDFLLRVEDTDQSRSAPEYEANIYKAIEWLGIDWDEGPNRGGPFGPYRQSERTEIYREFAEKLIKEGHAYRCFATAQELEEMRLVLRQQGKRQGYDRRYRNLSEAEVKKRLDEGQPYVVRLKIPLTGNCEFNDGIKGPISFPWQDVDDQILLKSDGFPTYHLANVVDDHLMEITHVIRGEEWISSTPKHVHLYNCFGWEAPEFYHMPLLLGSDGKKLSKRKNPTSVFYYRDSGFLKDAFVNFLTLMGYSREGEENEVYSLETLIKEFDPARLRKSGAIFDVRKLEWLNQQYLINNIPQERLWDEIKGWAFSDEKMRKLIPLVQSRIKTFPEFFELCDFMFRTNIGLSEELLTPKSLTVESSALLLQQMLADFEAFTDWDREMFESTSKSIAERFGVNHKKVVMPIFFATITGKHTGPPLFDSCAILGRDIVRARFLAAINILGGISHKNQKRLEEARARNDFASLIAKKGATV
ncbi:MAG: Glutamate--tRNA ligase [Chlamydiia bacterium]|nr:Glutamate--tRNA ligase [Chlamydiia bacterium]